MVLDGIIFGGNSKKVGLHNSGRDEKSCDFGPALSISVKEHFTAFWWKGKNKKGNQDGNQASFWDG